MPWVEKTTTILQPKTCRKLQRCRCVTKSRARPGRRTLVIRTGHIHPSQTGETTFQTSLRGGGWSESTVAG